MKKLEKQGLKPVNVEKLVKINVTIGNKHKIVEARDKMKICKHQWIAFCDIADKNLQGNLG